MHTIIIYDKKAMTNKYDQNHVFESVAFKNVPFMYESVELNDNKYKYCFTFVVDIIISTSITSNKRQNFRTAFWIF